MRAVDDQIHNMILYHVGDKVSDRVINPIPYQPWNQVIVIKYQFEGYQIQEYEISE